MTPVLVHGWGFDAGFWGPLLAALEIDASAFDLGFRGRPATPELPAERPRVAVGHSLGGLWLLMRRPFAWDGLVLINGFPRFTEGPDFVPAVAPRMLERMRRRLDRDPAGVVGEFLALCGSDERPRDLEPAALGQGLDWLRDWDARGRLAEAGPLLVLAGGDDPVVPPAMTEAAFPAGVEWLPGGGHLLPRTAPAWCAERILAFGRRL